MSREGYVVKLRSCGEENASATMQWEIFEVLAIFKETTDTNGDIISGNT